MDIGGLDVGINFKFENVPLFEDKEDEALLKLIDQGRPGRPQSRLNLENVFRDSFENDMPNLYLLERNLLMMQMAPGSSVGGSSEYLPFIDPLGLEKDTAPKASCPDWSFVLDSRSVNGDDLGGGNGSGRKEDKDSDASTLLEPCMTSDLVMNNFLNSSADEFPLPDIADVQEQIFLEDGHQALQPDDLLIPLDDASDGKALQEQLISQITGSEPLLASDNCEASTNGLLFDNLPIKSEVSVSSHKSLVICTQNLKGKGCCPRYKRLSSKRSKKRVRFDLNDLKAHEFGCDASKHKSVSRSGNDDPEAKPCSLGECHGRKGTPCQCHGRKGTPCQLTRFLQTLSNLGIGKKAIIRSCRKVNAKKGKKGLRNSYTLTRLHLPSKVKKVETSPGSPNVSIDGVDVQLPAGSIILAVVDETGSLVPVPATTRPLQGDLNTHHATSSILVPKLGMPAAPSSQFLAAPCIKVESPGVGLEALLTGSLEGGCGLYPQEMGGTQGALANRVRSIKEEGEPAFLQNGEIEEEFVDIETMSERTPVIEAVDLDSLLAEFEATENVNAAIKMGQSSPPSRPSPTSVPEAKPPKTLDAQRSSTFSSLIKVETPVSEAEGRCQAMAPGPPKLLPNISIKVKKVETSRPVKSLRERKNQMMLKRMTAHQRIKDSLPIEVIEKIRASGKRSSTKILTEALIPRLKKKKNCVKSSVLKRNLSNKRISKDKTKNNALENKENKAICSSTLTPFPTDHDYCLSPQKQLREKDSKFYNKIPGFYHHDSELSSAVAKSAMEGEDACKKDSGVESGDFSDSSIEVEESKKRSSDAGVKEASAASESSGAAGREPRESSPSKEVLYNRLPDYVTDIGNAKPREGQEAKEGEEEEEEKKSEDAAAAPALEEAASSSSTSLSSSVCSSATTSPTSSSSSTSPCTSSASTASSGDTCVIKKEPVEQEPKKKKLKLSEYRMRVQSSADNSRSNSPLVGELKKELKIKKEEGSTPGAQEEVVVLESPVAVPPTAEDREEGEIKEETEDKGDKNIPEVTQVPTKPSKVTPEAKSGSSQEEGKRTSRSSYRSSRSSKKTPTVIEIDLAADDDDDDVNEEGDRAKNPKVQQTKVGLIDTIPLSKMPTTSLGHSLLYSRQKATASPEKKKGKHEGKSSSSRRYNSSPSCSRSRSRSRSSRKSSRSHKSKGSGYANSHRKSRRRWTRSRSRSRSRSCSFSASSSSSYSYNSSRSRSRSYSKSFYSRSRSRSKSRRRRDRCKRSKRYARSRDRGRHRSRSKSPTRDGYSSRKSPSSSWRHRSRSRSPYGPASRHTQPHMSTRYMSRHRSIEEIERDVQERRVIYVGAIEEGTTRADLRRRFEKFGQIVDINIHFRERGDNYGFVTYRYRENAYQALEHGNDDASRPRYNLCFGGRRSFCKVQYSDLDAQNEDYDYPTTPSAMDYDSLLKAALQMRR